LATGVLVACGASADSQTAAPSTEAESSTGLECGGEGENTLEYDVDPVSPGADTAEMAGASALRFYVDRHGGEQVHVRPDAFGLRVDGRVVVVADVTAKPAGGFWVTTVHMCESYLPVETGPPRTIPPVGAEP
jgi:hypothetical protein